MGEIVEISQGDAQQNAVNGWGDTMGKIQYWCPEVYSNDLITVIFNNFTLLKNYPRNIGLRPMQIISTLISCLSS
ncbi:hypothetical protein E2986_11520 [Frieseomelitta varia]|uniref:Uncharacterized protein n=1 Tax=Frieseomelitta varia TaxID=561572 RepID=A0A833VPR1_9HYME|nr:hypothetical protein E2986_11520 [Frieseomelitta varia]